MKTCFVGFDVDGTLYDASVMRRRMFRHLCKSWLRGKISSFEVRVLRCYRQAAESIRREAPRADEGVARRHLETVARRMEVDVGAVIPAVRRWMLHEPLPMLADTVRPDADEVLKLLRARGIRLGVLSDYPAREKLEAMGLARHFDIVLSCHDPESDGYKPNGNGFRRLAAAAGVRPEACAYVGDRRDVDVQGAVAAGMLPVWLTRAGGRTGPERCHRIRNLSELGRLLAGRNERSAPTPTREDPP